MKLKSNQKGTCRCCLSEGRFETMESNTKQDPTLSYINMLQTVLGIKLIQVGKTSLICSACAIRLRQAKAFRKQVCDAEQAYIVRMGLLQDCKDEARSETEIFEIADDDDFDNSTQQSDVEAFNILKEQKEQFDNSTQQADIEAFNILKKHKEQIDSSTQQSDVIKSTFDVLKEQKEQMKIDFSKVNFNDTHFVYPIQVSQSSNKPQKRKKQIGTIPCSHCRKKFFTEEQKEAHFHEKHCTCSRCKRVFETPEQKNLHMELHLVQCPVCDEIFDTLENKQRHVARVHGLKCIKCGERVRCQDRAKHNFKKHGNTSTQCRICDVICPTKYHLHSHHRQRHMKEKNIQCAQCSFMAFDNSTLKRHMLSHSTEKKYVCDYCNKRFVRKSTLSSHIMIHTGQKKKVCKLCGEAFVQRASLKYHLEKKHPGDYY